MSSPNVIKMAILFAFFLLFILLFLSRVLAITLSKPDRFVNTVISKKDLALRGNIYTMDNFRLAKSEKRFSLALYPRSINPNKKEMLIDLISVYTGISKEEITKRLNTQKSRVVLIDEFSANTAKNLQYLSRILDSKRVFLSNENGIRFGLEVFEKEFKRIYEHNNTLSPILGFFSKNRKKGVSGVENYYDSILQPKQNGLIKGERDLKNSIIFTHETEVVQRKDGNKLYLTIDLVLQKKIENLLDKYKKELQADEIIAGVMHSKTGKIAAIATSNRFNPNHITKKDIPHMRISATQYSFEPGSIIKPIFFSFLLEYDRVNIYEVLNGYNGRYRLEGTRKTITDDHKEKWYSAENAIVFSSNIVMAQLAQRLNESEINDMLKKYEFNKKSGVEINYEVTGSIPSLKQLRGKIYKATASYGYGLKVNFMQLMKFYNVLNNDGKIVSPSLIEGYQNIRIKRKQKAIISPKNARIILEILEKTVKKGTGTGTRIKGLFVAGKTGTAHIAEKGQYVRKYNSSFFGFANDDTRHYTIGVTVVNPKDKYFASQTAVTVFREVLQTLIDQHYLTLKETDGTD